MLSGPGANDSATDVAKKTNIVSTGSGNSIIGLYSFLYCARCNQISGLPERFGDFCVRYICGDANVPQVLG
jgi:hypothetical protein